MKAVILAGGRGTRISQGVDLKPKPMVTIGGKPILWHIMKTYASFGVHDFIVCLGYKGYVIKEYFANYVLHSARSVTFDLGEDVTTYGGGETEPWRVTLVETGDDTLTGGRIKRIRPWVEEDAAFHLTYGDGLADVDIDALARFHASEGRLATVTTVSPPGRFGAIETEGAQVTRFAEKPRGGTERINGGFFVLAPSVLDYIEGDRTTWEREPLERLAAEGQLSAYAHGGFWQPMDTLRERDLLEAQWDSGRAPWTANW